MIAILDFLNQDPGLKILFQEADYFIFNEEISRPQLYQKYNYLPLIFQEHTINTDNYDTLFIISPLYDSCEFVINGQSNIYYKEYTGNYFNKMIDLIQKNNFKKVVIFDNYDYDYDPNDIFEFNNVSSIITEKNILFFKRYINKNKSYKKNVYPFPYIIFGYQCNIDMLHNFTNNKEIRSNYIIDRLFFSGSLIHHIDPVYKIERNRLDIFYKIHSRLGNYLQSFRLPHDQYINEMKRSKYCLDLLGVGDPNVRTFEILSCGSLRIAQRSNLTWNFEEDFCEETYFDDENDLFNKINLMNSDDALYQKCLDRQNYIVRKYMNVNCLKEYVNDIISRYYS
jgi:hypothetical protein